MKKKIIKSKFNEKLKFHLINLIKIKIINFKKTPRILLSSPKIS